jgi:hypothetical protein
VSSPVRFEGTFGRGASGPGADGRQPELAASMAWLVTRLRRRHSAQDDFDRFRFHAFFASVPLASQDDRSFLPERFHALL